MDKVWFENIKWSRSCIECKEMNGGQCPSAECAKDNYDKNGNEIPSYVFHADGSTLDEYLKGLE